MAKSYLDKSGLTYFWGKIKAYFTRNHLVPVQSKTYTSVVAPANNDPNGWLYFAKLKPDNNSATTQIYVKYRLRAEADGQVLCYQDSEVEYNMYADTVLNYRTYNNIRSTSYRAIYNHSLYRAKAAGITGGYGHLLGIRLTSSWNPATTANARTVIIDILETRNCSVEFLDSMVLYANAPGTGSTNYAGRSDYDGTTQGQTISGDRDTVNDLRLTYSGVKAGALMGYYTPIMQIADGRWESLNTAPYNSTAATKARNTVGFRLGEILFCNHNKTFTENALLDTWGGCYSEKSELDARYFFNGGTSMFTSYAPVYIVGTMGSDGLFYLDTTWWTQTIPTTEDGKVYVLFGTARSGCMVNLFQNNPAFKYVNGQFLLWTPESGNAAKVNSHSVNADVPSGAKFTDTVTTATTSGSGNAVTAITASNGALTVTKGTTFLTSHQDISGKADKSATVSTVTWDSTNKKLTKTINGSTTDVATAAALRTGLNVADGAEVNQNAFSNVKVGSTTVAADAKTDTLELVAGSNVTLTPDATNDKVTIAATDTTYGVATGAKDGLMSSSDKTKLDGLATVATSGSYNDLDDIPTIPTLKNVFGKVKVGSTTIEADTTQDTLELAAGTNITLTPDATNDKVTIATSAEVNQNAFSNVKVGSTTVAADSKTDTLELVAGDNISLTPDATNDKVTVAATGVPVISTTASPTPMPQQLININVGANQYKALAYNCLGQAYGAAKLDSSGKLVSGQLPAITRNDLMTLASKTYTGVIGSTNDDAGTYLYCMKVLPTSYYASWEITYRVTATITGVSEANGSGYETSIVHICGVRDTYTAYSTWNEVSNGSYRPYYYHCLYRAKAAGITGGYGHLLGISLRYAYNPITAANSRTVSFDLLETKNCAVTFFDSPTKYASCPGTGTTNYSTQTAFDGTTQGMSMTGDRNDVNYNNRENYTCRTTNGALYRYQLCLTKSDGSLVPINSVNNSVATNKTLTTDTFDPFGEIFFWNSTSTYSANAVIGTTNLYRQYVCDFRYSFNIGGYDTTPTLTARKPLYLVAVPQADGTAKLHSAPLSEALPTTENGHIYIYLGRVFDDTKPYRCILGLNHPVYWYKDGAVRLYNGTNYVAGDNISLDRNSSDGSVTINAVITEQLSVSTTSDKQVKIKNNSTTAEHYAIASSQKGAANGVASLGSDGKVPGAQLPDNSNLSAVEARVTALEGLLNVVDSWSPSSGYSIASSSSWSAALGSKAFQLAKGTYIVMFGADFSSNATGYRMIQINTSAAGNRYTPTGPAVNGNNTRLMGTMLLEPTATTNYYMYAFQNSGATLTVTPWARIIKIG